ncbi:MAG: AAC(3) family N-acetyltransferase [Anaerolineales bacterium]|nr:AAC(3) family N-acetyltransferase [Chloroflexota bacterium]MBL6980653.1 AAC(3) family N-acetyltransferase [Anaerolineales bacterium]
MVKFRDLVNSLRDLGLDGTKPAIAHASLSAFGHVQGGAEAVVGALLSVIDGLIMPTFTYKTMVTPESGPSENGINYGGNTDANRLAEFYSSDMPADPLMGMIAETLRQHPDAQRSNHPIYSFSGVNSEEVVSAQTREEPFAPVRVLTESLGFVLLLGVDHTANTSIHYGEQLAGRRQFIRWALTKKGVQECPRWPGCSYGFNAITPEIEKYTNKTYIGSALVQLIPLSTLIRTVIDMVQKDPLALLCDRSNCERCQAIRE